MTVKAPGPEGAGGAAIADRFKLDPVDTAASRAGTVSKKCFHVTLFVGTKAYQAIKKASKQM